MNPEPLLSLANAAHQQGRLLDSSLNNLKLWLNTPCLPQWTTDAIKELIEYSHWEEINDRFYKTLTFGTGGMRGRTIGKVLTKAEYGAMKEYDTPEHAAIGSNCLNDFNIIRATIGLFQYTQSYLKNSKKTHKPRLVIAHDMRHFSRHFCLLTASTWTQLGGEALIFEGPRSTPQLSFSIRHFKSDTGIVITASHNPPFDNGFKVYFSDGGQVISPHAEGIIQYVNSTTLEQTLPFLKIQNNHIITLSPDQEKPYHQAVLETIIDPTVFQKGTPSIVYTPIHGTGQVTIIPLLKKLNVQLTLVDEQLSMDPRFPTVQSPNPENKEAFTLSLQKANSINADIAIATDPDADRMGIAFRNHAGTMELISGNLTGCILSEYRITQYKALGILPHAGTQQAALIKTFVTTPLQEAIAKKQGLKIINTLTGFKWIAGKLKDYEDQLTHTLHTPEYDSIPLEKKQALMLQHSTFFVFGNEESYGYLGSDNVRDKDANSAVIMIAELAAYLKTQQLTFADYVDNLYLKYGYYAESLLNIYYEGATGSTKIKNILNSYRTSPPTIINNIPVTQCIRFETDTIYDADGKQIPHELFFFLTLENGYQYAVRGSGTEPKIKFYLFGHQAVSSKDSLPSVQKATQEQLNQLQIALKTDAQQRANT